jgi:anti-sigma B factor antagonist
MSFSLTTRKVDGVVVVDMSGKWTIGEPVLSLRQAIKRFVDDGSLKFFLNLGDVSYIDSSGLGELVTSYTSLKNREGSVNLLNLTKRAKDLLQMTKLLTVFDTYEDEASAVGALNS